ncbi:site-specific integrase [Yinghuangia soli]|uniref:Tyrosine-type recombinase/integrase n=1 Tax=Yinghuangia soli TaxID=2908204 RepID=A0AA41TXK5_9ACTN|nr:site-specific integrase [Yinghuangia soli]MCF2526933.1 tyrosine-type recombinase/integrase [Yinghuangia soli]
MPEGTITKRLNHVAALFNGLGLDDPAKLADIEDPLAEYRAVRPLATGSIRSYSSSLSAWCAYLHNPRIKNARREVRSRILRHPESEEFYAWLRSEGLAPRTCSQYAEKIDRMAEMFQLDPAALETRHVRGFITRLNMTAEAVGKDGISAAAHNGVLSAVRRFCKSIESADISDGIRRMSNNDAENSTVPATEKQVRQLLAYALATGDTVMYDFTILMAFTGLRISEVPGFRPSWLKFVEGEDEEADSWYIELPKSKGRHGKPAVKLLASDIVVRTFMGRPDRALAHWSAQKASARFSDFCAAAGYYSGHAHALRAFYATKLYYDSGHDLLLVSKQLRHANVKITQGYVSSLMTEARRTAVRGFGSDLVDSLRTAPAIPAQRPDMPRPTPLRALA